MICKDVECLRMPHGKSSGDHLVGNPSSDGHHGHTTVLDLLEPERLELLRFEAALALGEAERVVAVVPGNAALLVPLTVVGDALEPPGREEDLQPSGGGDHLNGVQGGSLGNVGEGGAGGGAEEPGGVALGAEAVGTGGAQVKGEVHAELLHHEADGGHHGDAAVLDLGVLEPLGGLGLRVLQNPSAEGGALVARLDAHAERLVDGCHLGYSHCWFGGVGGCERTRGSDQRCKEGALHLPFYIYFLSRKTKLFLCSYYTQTNTHTNLLSRKSKKRKKENAPL
mmetsp:Transcript_3621/g.5253  ORF Transcript_3621/g.5253 Transcript_3621/m.5253 type:complete len:282 (-) Transcript_3621:603-1448(-)